MNVQKVYYMINTVLQLSTPTLIIGGMACTTLIPAIEAALRAIVGTGQLMLNRCHYSYKERNFSPSKSFKTASLYKNVGLEYIAEIEKDIDDSKLRDSCVYDINKPNSKLTLKYLGKIDCTFNVDKDAFKEYSVYYKNLSEDFEPFNDTIGSDADTEIEPCIIPENFTEESFQLLNYYLNNKSNFTANSKKLNNLNLRKVIDLYNLALYLNIRDLEFRCILLTKKLIDAGSVEIDHYNNDADKKVDRIVFEDISFNNLLLEIKKFKIKYNETDFKISLLNLYDKRFFIKDEIIKQLNFSFKCLRHTLVPIVGPIYTHMERYLNANGVNHSMRENQITSISSDIIIAISLVSLLASPFIALGAGGYALSLALRSRQVVMVASIALLPIKAAFFVLGAALKVIVFVATPILKVTGSILVIGLLAAALIR